jgi:C-terminal processing protease CtpA/Prc
MKSNMFSGNLMWFLFLSGLLMTSACKKEHHVPNPVNRGGDSGTVARSSDEDSLKFYTWYYMESDSQNIPQYYWYSQVPSINPFSDQYANADSLLETMKRYTSENSVKPVDRYSFLDRTGAVSGEIEQGQLGDKGLDIRWAGNLNNDSTYLYVVWTYRDGPAGEAGVQRGWQIIGVNGDSHVMYDGPGYGDGSGADANNVINAVFTADQATFKFRRPDGSDTVIALANAQYNFNPVLADSVYTVNGAKVGYVVFNSFVSVYNYDKNDNQVATPAKAQIDQVFDKFQSAGIKDLIVDLRYNGGGAVNTAEYLDNLIAPSGETGKTMYTYAFNKPMESYYTSNSIGLSVPFQKQGNLALDHVFFIVSDGTVSASELTINNLKPVMDVKLIGSTTFGKPVGFIPQSISVVDDTTHTEKHMADLYAINFETKNQSGVGGYFKGLTPDKWNSDFVDLNWGDRRDSCLLEALSYVQTGNWVRSAHARLAESRRPIARRQMNRKIVARQFTGMVETRLRLHLGNPAMSPLRNK